MSCFDVCSDAGSIPAGSTMTRICDLPQANIKEGLKIRSLKDPYKIGVITKVDAKDDDYAWIKWPGDDKAYSGFYGTDCKCEIVE